jgi:hypothetical protein
MRIKRTSFGMRRFKTSTHEDGATNFFDEFFLFEIRFIVRIDIIQSFGGERTKTASSRSVLDSI